MSVISTRSVIRWAACLLLLGCCVASHAQLSGQFGLDFIARRIPTTLTGEIDLDTPSEFVSLEFAIASKAVLNIDFGFCDLDIDAAVNTAGAEHLVLKTPLRFGGLPVYGVPADELSVVPEVWFAVPFEAVTDVNNLPNSAVIPPGDIMFVKARVTLSTSIAGFSIKILSMLDDINFPNPGSSYTPLYYPVQSQSFAVGSLISASWRTQMGVSASASLGFNASSSGRSIRGYSSTGSVIPGNFFARIGVSGIKLTDIPIPGTMFQSVLLGTSFSFTKLPTESEGSTAFSSTISLSGQLWDNVGISGSITLRPLPAAFGGVTLSITAEPFRLAFTLDTMTLSSMSASISSELNIGAMTGSWGASFTGLERGLTGASVRLSLAQGIFSAATSVSYATRGEKFGFASWASTLTFRFSPAVVTVQATFGRHGLTRAAVTGGVSF
ncbi:hypothetical protein ACFLSZ_06575 [Candidatus Bipolaricaulota bacterium]